MEPFIISYIVQIGLGIYGFSALKIQPGMSQMFVNMRNATIGLAFLPCPVMAPMIQLIYIGIFKAREGVAARSHAKANAALIPTFDVPGGAAQPGGAPRTAGPANNPFDTGAPAARPPVPPAANPFDSGGGAPAAPAAPNPFDAPAPGQTRPPAGPENNPFG